MLDYVCYKMINAQQKLAKKFFFTSLYESNVGIKYSASIFNSQILEINNDIIYMNPNELFLEFDGLKDKYTLCGVSLIDSPHLDFLKAIQSGDNLKNTDYVQRCLSGTLDLRKPFEINMKMLSFFEKKFHERLNEVLSDEYKPIIVFNVDGQYYIADGKHRAAMCLLLGKKIKCQDIGKSYLNDSFNHWIYEKMKNNPNDYKRNISFFDRLYRKQQ